MRLIKGLKGLLQPTRVRIVGCDDGHLDKVDTVIFAGQQNARSSQVAAALFNAMADPQKAVAISAGVKPAKHVPPEVVTVLRELDIDIAGAEPKPLTDAMVNEARLLITMGCGEALPLIPGLEREDWPVIDNSNNPSLERVRRVQEILLTRVTRLIDARGWQ